MAGALTIVKPGILATVQDLGRSGWGRYGVSPSGAMDPLAARAANRLAGNAAAAALLEITGPGCRVRLDGARRVALCGGDLGAEIVTPAGARAARPWRAEVLGAGDELRTTARRRGARVYLAVAGGVVVAPLFGSAATDVGSGLGGVDGRSLRAGQTLALGAPPASLDDDSDGASAAAERLTRWYDDPFRLRFVPAPGALFAPETVERFVAASYRLTPQSSRMGFRLDGPALERAPGGRVGEAISEPLPAGTIQIPGDGRPILLMADRQTVGGYPAVGYLIRADLPKAAQLWPGDTVRFAPVSLAAAEALARAQRADAGASGAAQPPP
jgi:antagonist of KipI